MISGWRSVALAVNLWHNYAIPQAMPHATPQAMPHAILQAHSAFSPSPVYKVGRSGNKC